MKDFLTTSEIGERLGVSRQHVSRLVKLGRIPATRSGRLIRIPRLAWEHYLAAQTEEAMTGMKEKAHAQAA